jgi:putative flippase GtrA
VKLSPDNPQHVSGPQLPRAAARVARFSVVGTLGTVVYYAMLGVLVELMRVPILLATSIAFLLVCVENYLLHYRWTFDSTKEHEVAIACFVFMNGVGFFINWAIMFGGVESMKMNYLLVQAVALVAVVMWNFMLSSCWVFRSSRELDQAERMSSVR